MPRRRRVNYNTNRVNNIFGAAPVSVGSRVRDPLTGRMVTVTGFTRPNTQYRRRQLTSVARSVMSTASQRRFSRTSAATTAANLRSATTTLDPISNRRYVRFRTARRGRGGQYTVGSRRQPGMIVGRYVGMAH